MPRRNRRRPSNEPTDFTRLADELHRASGVRAPRAVRASRADRVVSLDEARALLGL